MKGDLDEPKYLAGIHLFKVNKENWRSLFKINKKCSGIFLVNFDYIAHLFLVFLLLTLNS